MIMNKIKRRKFTDKIIFLWRTGDYYKYRELTDINIRTFKRVVKICSDDSINLSEFILNLQQKQMWYLDKKRYVVADIIALALEELNKK